MLLTLLAAIIFAFHAQAWGATLTVYTIGETTFLAIVFVVSIGLLQQALFLWRFRRTKLSSQVLTGEANASFGTFVSIVTRCAVAGMLLFSAISRGVFGALTQDSGQRTSAQFQFIWEPLLPIWLIVALCFSRQAQRLPRNRIWHKTIRLGSGFASAALIALVLADSMFVTFLVFLAVRGIELSRANAHTPLLPELDQNVMQRLTPAVWLTFVSLLVLAMTASALRLYSRNAWQPDGGLSVNRRRSRAKLLLGIAWGCVLVLTVLLAYNVYGALPNAMPWIMDESSTYSIAEIAVNGVPLVLLVGFAFAFRITRRPGLRKIDESRSHTVDERPMPMPICWHERPIVLVFCGFVALLFVQIEIADWIQSQTALLSTLNPRMSWNEALAMIVSQPELILGQIFLLDSYDPGNTCMAFIALMLLCIALAWRARKKSIKNYPVFAPNYGPPGRFWIVLLLVIWLVVLCVPQLSITGFMLNALHFYF